MYVCVCVSASDVEDVDNEKREMNEGDIASLHQFYSKHLDFPDHSGLLTLFSQVTHTHTLTPTHSHTHTQSADSLCS